MQQHKAKHDYLKTKTWPFAKCFVRYFFHYLDLGNLILSTGGVFLLQIILILLITVTTTNTIVFVVI